MNAPLRLYSVPEVCTLTGLSRASIDREIRAGNLKALKVRARVLVSNEALESWLFRCSYPAQEKSSICRVPASFRIVSREERASADRKLLAQAKREVLGGRK